MSIFNKKEPILLFLGDVVSLLVALWLMLFLRYAEIPTLFKFTQHLLPFSFLFVVWVLIFFIAGLYEKRAILLKSKLPSTLLNAEILNCVIAVLFFYFIPYFGITPKTNLFIYLILSFFLVLGWRIYAYPSIGVRKKENAILIGHGSEMEELKNEVNTNKRYGLHFVSTIDLNDMSTIDFKEDVLNRVFSEEVQVIAVDLHNEKVEPVLPHLYNLIFSKVRFVDMHKIYEDIFDRVPLSLLRYSWFLENISVSTDGVYDILKRIMDIVIALPLLVVPLICYPFIFVLMKMEDGGPIFTYQRRVGKNNAVVELVKYRSMLFNDAGEWQEKGKQNRVTKVGSFLRKTRLDEFPQLWNVLIGDISLIGPRPEFPEPVKRYTEEIPYYNVRHIIKPGLSGWAQLYHDRHPHHGVDTKETKNKLSYDLYYIKNRSFLLDLTIALKTIKELLSRKGV
jgi:exopolysaccharide biosynthesis polyprenyl glycosylphosphotransferase